MVYLYKLHLVCALSFTFLKIKTLDSANQIIRIFWDNSTWHQFSALSHLGVYDDLSDWHVTVPTESEGFAAKIPSVWFIQGWGWVDIKFTLPTSSLPHFYRRRLKVSSNWIWSSTVIATSLCEAAGKAEEDVGWMSLMFSYFLVCLLLTFHKR